MDWTVPRFAFGSSIDGNHLLESLGVTRMFTDLAEFPGISDRRLQVSKVIQETHIGLDEKGVEGAAYTALMMMDGCSHESGNAGGNAAGPSLCLRHPVWHRGMAVPGSSPGSVRSRIGENMILALILNEC